MAFPACEAVRVQTPVPLVMVTSYPAGTCGAMVHTPVAATVTVKPEDAVGLIVKVETKFCGLAGCAKVMVWLPLCTIKVKSCVFVPAALAAVKVMLYVPTVPAAGVPLKTWVAALNVTPAGKASPPIVHDGAGKPVAVVVNVPAVPTEKVTVLALVITGAC